MTGKEIMLRAIRFEKVPRTPVAIIDGGAWMARHANVSFEDIFTMHDFGTELVLDTFCSIRSDIVWVGSCACSLMMRALGAKTDFSKIGRLPVILAPLIKKPKDICAFAVDTIEKILLSDPGIQAMLEQTRRVSDKVYGESCIGIYCMGPFTLAAQMVGISELLISLFDEAEEVHRLIDFATKLCCVFFKLFIEAGVNTVLIADPSSSGGLISPVMFEEFSMPYLKKLNALIGNRASIRILHICGSTMPRLEPLKKSGIQAFSLDAPDIGTAMLVADRKYAVLGNISPDKVLCLKTPEEIYEICIDAAKIGGLDGGFVLMPGCDLAPETPLKNIQAMIRAAHDNKITGRL